MNLSLKTSGYSVMAFISITLCLLVFIGFRQYQSQKHYENIIDQNEKIVFQFAGIREHITESLIEGRHKQLAGIVSEVETLNSNILQILEENSIPNEYRLSFAGQIDLGGIILLLRNIAGGDVEQPKIRQLNQEVRILGDRLMLFDRIIVNHVKRKLVGFQSVVIGVLAIVTFIVINILLYWHRQVTIPLLNFLKELGEIKKGKRQNVSVSSKSGEVAGLVNSYHDLLQRQLTATKELVSYRDLFNNAQDLIFILSGNGSIMNANQTALKLIDHDLPSVLGRDLVQVLDPTSENKQLKPIINAIKNKKTILNVEISILNTDYLLNISPVAGSGNDNGLILVVARDISVRKNSESQTIKASRLAAMGELAVGVAHEINNLSNGLINYAQILLDDFEQGKDDESHGETLNSIMQQGERIANTVRPLLFFNSKRSRPVEAVPISKVIQEAISLIRHQLKHDGIEISIDLSNDLPPVQIDTQKIQHVLLNILNNARHALNTRYPENSADKRVAIKGETAYYNDMKWLRINFTDQGTGIDPGIINNIFEPFFTTKAPEEGTGLGLSICKSLIEDNKGNIKIESIPNHHTLVIIDLPLA